MEKRVFLSVFNEIAPILKLRTRMSIQGVKDVYSIKRAFCNFFMKCDVI